MIWTSLALATNLADVQQALSEGDCDRAATVAQRWIDASPDEAAPWRALGDAHRCGGDAQQALGAYRASATLKADPGLAALISSLSAPFASMTVTVEGEDPEVPLSLTVDGQAPVDGVVWDLPAETSLVLTVGGPGYETTTVPFTTPAAGLQGDLAVTATFLGRGTLTVGAMGDGVVVLLDNKELTPGDHTVLAGDRVLHVSGPTGTMQHAVTLEPEATVTVEPMQLLPASVKLLKVPEGATIRFLSGPGEHAPILLERGVGELDDTLGLSLTDVSLEGLAQGEWFYQMDHPILGSLEGRFFAVAGQLSAEPVPWKALPTVAPLEAEYAAYKENAGGSFGKKGWLAVGLTGAAGGVAAVGVNQLQGAKAATSSAGVYRDNYNELTQAGDIDGANEQYLLLADAQSVASRRRIIGYSGLGAATLCAAAATWLWVDFAKSRQVEAWNPWPEA